MTDDTLLEFPCDFPIKIMGKASDEFRSLALGIVARHFGEIRPERVEERPSRGGRYLSITCTVRADNKAQIDDCYMDLTACQQVLVAL